MGGIRKLSVCGRNLDKIYNLNSELSPSKTINNITPDVTEGAGTGVNNLSNSITIT